MWSTVVLAASDNIEAAGFILRGIKGIFVAIGSIIAAVVCAVIAGMKGRNPFGWGILANIHFPPTRRQGVGGGCGRVKTSLRPANPLYRCPDGVGE